MYADSCCKDFSEGDNYSQNFVSICTLCTLLSFIIYDLAAGKKAFFLSNSRFDSCDSIFVESSIIGWIYG